MLTTDYLTIRIIKSDNMDTVCESEKLLFWEPDLLSPLSLRNELRYYF